MLNIMLAQHSLYEKGKAVYEEPFTISKTYLKELLEEADYIGSTSGIINYAKEDDAKEYIIGTEVGVLYELKKQNPSKTFYLLSDNQICPDMKYITLEKILDVLENETNQIIIDETMRLEAMKPLQRMLELGK